MYKEGGRNASLKGTENPLAVYCLVIRQFSKWLLFFQRFKIIVVVTFINAPKCLYSVCRTEYAFTSFYVAVYLEPGMVAAASVQTL